MKDILLKTCGKLDVKITMIGGPLPYMGVHVKTEDQDWDDAEWHYVDDSSDDYDLLLDGAQSCAEATKKIKEASKKSTDLFEGNE